MDASSNINHLSSYSSGLSDDTGSFDYLFPPHPGPLPLGEGESFGHLEWCREYLYKSFAYCSLSPRERARVRGNRLVNIKRVSEFEDAFERSTFDVGRSILPPPTE